MALGRDHASIRERRLLPGAGRARGRGAGDHRRRRLECAPGGGRDSSARSTSLSGWPAIGPAHLVKGYDGDRTWHTATGIVEEPPTVALGSALHPQFAVYASVLQHPPMNVELLVRRRAGAAAGQDVRLSLAGALGTGRPQVREMAERTMLASELTLVAWFGRLFKAEGWAILLIAALASAVQYQSMRWASRRSESGLRRAVGATRWRVLGLVLLRAAGVGAAGTAGGLILGPGRCGRHSGRSSRDCRPGCARSAPIRGPVDRGSPRAVWAPHTGAGGVPCGVTQPSRLLASTG